MSEMTSLQRVLTTLSHQEPDRVPLFLLPSLHGAKALELSIKDYFSKSSHVVEGQKRLVARYQHDCYYSFFHAPLEVEAWGGEVIFAENGPPNSGEPFLKANKIMQLTPPRIEESPGLLRVLEATRGIKKIAGDTTPIVGVVISPFSIPVMQMGFESYLDLIYGQPGLFERLMRINSEFCIHWANAQLEAGATAICYFDPVSSPTIIPRSLYLKTGHVVAKQTLAQIKGPTATHLASGHCLPIVNDLAQTGTAVIGVSAIENLAQVKAACSKRLTILGNLNGIEMRRWTPAMAEAAVKNAIAKAARGGGYILADNHGEIPWQTPDEVLLAISDAVRHWGQYPLDWLHEGAQ